MVKSLSEKLPPARAAAQLAAAIGHVMLALPIMRKSPFAFVVKRVVNARCAAASVATNREDQTEEEDARAGDGDAQGRAHGACLSADADCSSDSSNL